jgi:serine/threonine protein kinase
MGLVRKGRSKKTAEAVAIKSVRIADSDGIQFLQPEELAQLTEEVEITFSCRHPNIVRTREAFRGITSIDIVMDLAIGGEVMTSFAESSLHCEKDTQSVLRQVCSALDYLHGRRIAHRDIKPENVVYVDEQKDSIKLVDFGFAAKGIGTMQQSNSGVQPNLLTQRTLVGTAPFMAPELFQSMEGEKLRIGDRCVSYDTSIDMWAVGVWAYLAFFGVLPFAPEGRFLAEFQEASTGDWSFPAELQDDYTPYGLEFITACLDKNAGTRITATDACSHLWFRTELSDQCLPHFQQWQTNLRGSLQHRDPAVEAAERALHKVLKLEEAQVDDAADRRSQEVPEEAAVKFEVPEDVPEKEAEEVRTRNSSWDTNATQDTIATTTQGTTATKATLLTVNEDDDMPRKAPSGSKLRAALADLRNSACDEELPKQAGASQSVDTSSGYEAMRANSSESLDSSDAAAGVSAAKKKKKPKARSKTPKRSERQISKEPGGQ